MRVVEWAASTFDHPAQVCSARADLFFAAFGGPREEGSLANAFEAPTNRSSVLLVEDEPLIRSSLSRFLRKRDIEVVAVANCAEAERAVASSRPDLALVDFELPDGTALRLLPPFRDAGIPVLVLTGNGSIERAVSAVKEGAEQFLTKPVELEALFNVIERTLENERNRHKQLASDSGETRHSIDPFLGDSPAILRLREDATRLASADSPVLIQGETGSGKGVLARWMHQSGPRAKQAFVDLNCAGLAKDLLESELFGHERGAFTGAAATKKGLLEIAHRGTVFLDEIGDADASVQPRLLKVLEEKRFRRLGDVHDRIVDIRLIAATHHDLAQAARERRFREDLYFRISTLPLRVPALRERVQDIAQIAAMLLQRVAPSRGALQLSTSAVARLQEYSWPGNVRELRNVLERAALLSKRQVLEADDLRFDHSAAPAPATDASLQGAERRHLEGVLQRARSVAAAAEQLGVARSTLYYKLKKHRIDLPKA
jgi:DNA-binding NtrC family response regulator